MINKKTVVTKTFNDGVVKIYRIANTADPGRTPSMKKVEQVISCRFGKKRVGLGRYWSAMQNEIRIDQLVEIPAPSQTRQDEIVLNTEDIAIINGQNYYIKQIQEANEELPPSWILSLQRTTAKFEFDQKRAEV